MKHPYQGIGPHARWDSGVSGLDPAAVDPVVAFPLRLTPEQPIVTAGSCFAQHIARYLDQSGFNYLVTEPGHPLLRDDLPAKFNYGVFSARYGNIYTSRQLVQLARRAYGTFEPADDIWGGKRSSTTSGPTIQPGGFATKQEYYRDREQHFAAVRRALEELEILCSRSGSPSAGSTARTGRPLHLRRASRAASSVRNGTSSPISASTRSWRTCASSSSYYAG